MTRHFRHRPAKAALATSLAVALMAGASPAVLAQDQAPITIVINQSPWFDGFRGAVELYEEETGNTVNLDVNPFAGSLEKQRAAVRSGESPFDILIINAGFFIEMYEGGFLTPLNDIDADFKPDPEVYTFDDSVYYDSETKLLDAENGDLLTVPINPNIPLLYYRSDLYEEAGLKVPETLEQLLENAKALHEPPARYGIVQRGARETFAVTYEFFPYLWGFGGDIFKDAKGGDFSIVINSPESKKALDFWLELAKDAGHPNTGAQSQADIIQAMLTQKAGHIVVVIAAFAQMDDPNKSAVVDLVDYAVAPAAEGHKPAAPLGHWLGGIPKNIPEAQKKAALAFLDWFQGYDAQVAYAEAGGPPVREDVMRSDLANEKPYRWMTALADALPNARITFTTKEASEILAVTELRLNQAATGELTSAEAVNTMATEISEIMTRAGYDAPTLPPIE